jgi:AraC family transcriptional regulator
MPDCLCRVIRHIDANIHERLDLDRLACVCGKSTERFRHRFKAVMGVSPHAFVMQRRVEAAAKMLEADGASLADVAYACGFGSQARFTVVFKAARGLTPGAYKKMKRRALCACLAVLSVAQDMPAFAI